MGFFGLFKPNVNRLTKEKDVEKLIKLLGYKKDANIQLEAARALGLLKDKRAVDPLIHILRNTQFALPYMPPSKPPPKTVEGIEALLKGYSEIGTYHATKLRETAAWALGMIADAKAVSPLLSSLRDKNEDCFVKVKAVEALAKIGEPALNPLMEALKCCGSEEILYEAQTLTIIAANLKRADALLMILQHPAVDDMDKGQAARNLGKMGDARAVDPLITALRVKSHLNDYNWRESIIEILGEMGDARAVDPLIIVLKTDGEECVRMAAASALGEIGDSRAIAPIERYIELRSHKKGTPEFNCVEKALENLKKAK